MTNITLIEALTETKLTSTQIYQGKLLNVMCDTVRLPDGKTATREYIKHPGAVAIMAINANNHIVVERQYRYPVSRITLEIPAGKIDKQETELNAAKRELLEETGYSAKNWLKLGACLPCVAYATEQISYYLATELTAGEANTDEGEFIEALTMPLDEFMELALKGEICDSKTMAGLLLYQGYLSGKLK